MSKKTIVFTGGGSAGHVTPNIAIIGEIKHEWDIHYIGSKNGIEKELIEKINIPYYGISSGKLRRQKNRNLDNMKDVFKVLKGCLDARRVLKRLKPNLVFSKGGFVSVPVIVAARSLGIPIFMHESDITPGLANKISQRFATKIFTSFDETVKFFPKEKTMSIGSPIRKGILTGSAAKGRQNLDFVQSRPILTIMGGSLGARKINEVVRKSLDEITKHFQVVHLCGKNNLDPALENIRGYRQFEYVHEELADILAATDIVLTRGGSNAIFEFLALRIPMLIVPLGLNQSRGDQILNAKAFQEKGYSLTLEEDKLNKATLLEHLNTLLQNKETYQQNMRDSGQGEALQTLVDEINKMK